MKIVTAIVAVLFLFSAEGGLAGQFVVNAAGDAHDLSPGDGACAADDLSGCSLRSAIEEANNLIGPDTIIISSTVGLVTLSQGTLVLTDNATMIRGEAIGVVIDGFLNIAGSAIFSLRSDSNAITGLTLKRSRADGMLIIGAGNVVGGPQESDEVILIQNGLDPIESAAIRISGSRAVGNRILGCTIGTNHDDDENFSNRQGLVIEQNASGTVIDDCLISGNTGWGIQIRARAHDNTVRQSKIGLDRSGLYALANGSGGILISGGAHDNTIGELIDTFLNVVSGNSGDGICIAGVGTSGNRIIGTVIGLDATAVTSLGNGGAGVHFADRCTDNTLGGSEPEARNLIGGNWLDGVLMEGAGTSANRVIGNWIGIAANAFRARSNGLVMGNGISIRDQAGQNEIGGPLPGERNVIAGEQAHAILLTGAGTSHNRIRGNFIGINPTGQYSFYNGSGVVVRDGATHNTIGGSGPGDRNVISGSANEVYPYGGGVMLYDEGTSYNIIQGNYIGLDSAGSRLTPNATAGIVIGNGASHNTIGGELPGQGNVISGNGYGTLLLGLGRGIHIEGAGTSYNTVAGNYIGTVADGTTGLRNFGHGIAIVGGAGDNLIGGESAGAGNTIAFNRYHGIFINDNETTRNSLRQNSLFRNDSAAIVIANGAQDGLLPPIIMQAISGSNPIVYGWAPGQAGTVDIYLAAADNSGAGEPKVYLGSANVISSGGWNRGGLSFAIGDTLTAVYTSPDKSSSACAENYIVSFASAIEDDSIRLPGSLELTQNYPNPFNPVTEISFSLPTASQVSLIVFNVMGQQVAVLVEGRHPAGDHRVRWDGTDNAGKTVASGVYFYRLQTADGSRSRKMLLLR